MKTLNHVRGWEKKKKTQTSSHQIKAENFQKMVKGKEKPTQQTQREGKKNPTHT